jgi:hypothetical protein
MIACAPMPSAHERWLTAYQRWLTPGSRSRRLLFAFGVYVVCAVTYAVVAGPQRMGEHTQYNHYAHLAHAWLHGRQDLVHGAPPYAMGNDFAVFEGKTYISFPPFPAVLMVPFVALAGSPENFRDGQFIVWLAGLSPAVIFLVLEKLRRTGRSPRTERQNVALSLLFAFGTVYFFTAVEGFVWFAAHVVGVGLLALYTLFALDAEHPLLAGAMLGFAFATRPPILLTAPLFALEAIRVCTKDGLPTEGSFLERAKETWARVDKPALARRYAAFGAPIAAVILILSWMNYARFRVWSPSVGHEYLTVAWAGRIHKWGLFGYHYLAKNLGCLFSMLPWLSPKGTPVAWLPGSTGAPPFQINEHGLALWFTTPIYLWLLWPKERGWLHDATWLSVVGPAVMVLLYQNSGWRTFGYRFSNDYSVLLFVLLAIGKRPYGKLFGAAAVWSVAWSLFGAITFDRGDAAHDRYYFREGSQTVMYQPD